MKLLQVVILLLTALLTSQEAVSKYAIFCNWDTESSNRKQGNNFQYWNVDMQLCSHIVHDSSVRLDPSGSGELQLTNKMFVQQHGRPSIMRMSYKSLISIGGQKGDSRLLSKLMADGEKRDQFYKSLIKLLLNEDFNGVLIKWEYSAQIGSQPEDRDNFITLLSDLEIILQDAKLLLAVSVSARLDKDTLGHYDIPQIAELADFIVLNIHDPDDAYSQRLEYNAPLFGDGRKSVERSVQHWVKHSKSPSKLILGVPLFGQVYTLKDFKNTAVDAPSKGPSRKFVNLGMTGRVAYGELCRQLAKWEKKFDKEAQVPYAHKGDEWVTYESGQSISAKMHFIEHKQLGGAMIYSVDLDDFNGKCGESFSLLKVVVSVLGDPRALSASTEAPHTGPGICPSDGIFRNPWECDLYYECRGATRIDYMCPDGLYFDLELLRCKPMSEVECEQDFVTWRPGQNGYNFRNLPLNLKIVN